MPGCYLWGWDADNTQWVKVLVNADGKLIIDPSEIFEDPPTDGETGKAPNSNWAFDHNANPAAHHAKYTDAEARAAINNIFGSDGKADTDIDLDGHILKSGGARFGNQAVSTQNVITQNAYYEAPNWKYTANGFAALAMLSEVSGVFIIYTAPSGVAGNNITWTERFRVANDGDLTMTGTVDGVDIATHAATPDAHDHSSLGADTIPVEAVDSNIERAILGDSTKGRKLSVGVLRVYDGTNANTLKCRFIDQFNMTEVSEVDNVAKGATTGGFTLDAAGEVLKIENSILDGVVQAATGRIIYLTVGTDYRLYINVTGGDIALIPLDRTAGTNNDWTALVDSGIFWILIWYITAA